MYTLFVTHAERRAAAVALREWLATYSQGVRPEGYGAVRDALEKIEEKAEED